MIWLAVAIGYLAIGLAVVRDVRRRDPVMWDFDDDDPAERALVGFMALLCVAGWPAVVGLRVVGAALRRVESWLQ